MSRWSASGTAWEAQRQRVLQRDGWVCAYCGVDLVTSRTAPNGATVDHVEPVVANPGRTYADHELVACCRRCNGIKQDRVRVRTEYRAPGWFGKAL